MRKLLKLSIMLLVLISLLLSGCSRNSFEKRLEQICTEKDFHNLYDCFTEPPYKAEDSIFDLNYVRLCSNVVNDYFLTNLHIKPGTDSQEFGKLLRSAKRNEESLIQHLSSDNKYMCANSALILALINSENATTPLVRNIVDNDDVEVKKCLAIALCKIASSSESMQADEDLMNHMFSQVKVDIDDEVKNIYLVVLSVLNDADTFEYLTNQFEWPSEMDYETVFCLTFFGDKSKDILQRRMSSCCTYDEFELVFNYLSNTAKSNGFSYSIDGKEVKKVNLVVDAKFYADRYEDSVISIDHEKGLHARIKSFYESLGFDIVKSSKDPDLTIKLDISAYPVAYSYQGTGDRYSKTVSTCHIEFIDADNQSIDKTSYTYEFGPTDSVSNNQYSHRGDAPFGESVIPSVVFSSSGLLGSDAVFISYEATLEEYLPIKELFYGRK